MFTNQIKIIFRHLLKDRQFTFLNLMGLSVGLACTFLIFLWVKDELKIDGFHEMDHQLYQVMANQPADNGIATIPQTSALLADALLKDLAEVEHAVAVQTSFSGKFTLTVDRKNIKAVGLYAGPDFFKIFSFSLSEGSKSQVLSDKRSIVITKDLAAKLFNTTENIVGRTLQLQNDQVVRISGVVDHVPATSTIQFDLLIPMEQFLDANEYAKDWTNLDPSTYVVLHPETNIQAFNQKMAGYMKSKHPDSKTRLFVRPFSKGYLYGKYQNGVQVGGRIEYVRLFSIIALFILIIACINFMNLSTAKASRRLKEIGIKKVLGATRRTLIMQYVTESMLMAFMSLVLATIIVILSLSTFNNITGKDLTLFSDFQSLLWVLGIVVFTGVLSGSYPAIFLSGFDPITVLKGKMRNSSGELWVRKGLVVFQFVLSVVFIVSVLVVYRQISYIQTQDQGFSKDHVISFDMEGMTPQNMEAFLSGVNNFVTQVRNIPGVLNASSMDHGSIVGEFGITSDIVWEGSKPDVPLSFANIGANYGLLETLGMQIVAGRSFNRAVSSDSSEIIFNQAAIQMMGLKDPIGKVVKMWGKDRTIVGIVKNFNFESFHQSVKPYAIRLEPKFTYRVVVKMKSQEESATIDRIQAYFQKYNPGYAFDYRFLDQDYQAQYEAEKRISVLSRYFAGLTILISCLGLFGIAAFTAQRRQKEISIRKVVGASVARVTVMLFKDFLQLVGVAIIIAFPLAWWMMNQWLDNFAYRIDIGVDIFLIAAVSIFGITILTVSYQGLKAAIANPIKNLRSE